MSDVPTEVTDWCARFALAVGTDPPSLGEIESLLELAGVAAHASQRQAAPVACWLAARAGVSPDEALEVARGL
jgi:hypothetical protein